MVVYRFQCDAGWVQIQVAQQAEPWMGSTCHSRRGYYRPEAIRGNNPGRRAFQWATGVVTM